MTEGGGPDQGLARIGPSIGMCVVRVIDVQVVIQAGFKVGDRTKIPTFEKTSGEHAEPQFDLIKPRAMFGGKMENMLMARIAQKGPPLHASDSG